MSGSLFLHCTSSLLCRFCWSQLSILSGSLPHVQSPVKALPVNTEQWSDCRTVLRLHYPEDQIFLEASFTNDLRLNKRCYKIMFTYLSKTSESCCTCVLGVRCLNCLVIDQTVWFQAIKPISEIINGVMDDFFGKMLSWGYNTLGCCCIDAIGITLSLFLSAAGWTKAAAPSLFGFLSYQLQCDVSALNANAADGKRALDRQFLSVFASFVIVKASSLFILLVSSWVGMTSEASYLIWAWTKASCR